MQPWPHGPLWQHLRNSLVTELLSEMVLARLRDEAAKCGRPKERLATLDRLTEACDAIASGAARKLVQRYRPDAAFHFARATTPIIPPRVDDYVRAKQAEDGARRQATSWTGPTATTLRKDKGLLEYVRARAAEQGAAVAPRTPDSLEALLAGVTDLALRAELRIRLARGHRAEQDALRLKQAMRLLRAPMDIEPPGAGTRALPRPTDEEVSAVPRADVVATAILILGKLTTKQHLARCGLEYLPDVGNLVERRTRYELLTREDLRALASLAAT